MDGLWRMDRRHILRLVGATALTGILAACGEKTSEAPTVGRTTTASGTPASTVTGPSTTGAATSVPPAQTGMGGNIQLLFRQFDPPNQIMGLEKTVTAWNAKNSKIQVKLETVPLSEAQNQYVREVQAGGGPDVQHLAFVWVRDLGKNGLLQPLDQLITSSPPGKGLSDFIGTDLGTFEGKTYGLPWTVDTQALTYRPDLLDKAGVKIPDTWDDLLTTAQKLTTTGQSAQYGFFFPAGSGPDGGMWFLVNYYLWSNGKFFVQQNGGGKWETGATAQDVAGAMNYFNSFFTKSVTPKSFIAVNDGGDPSILGGLGRGDCVMTTLNPIQFRAAEAQSQSPLASAPIPRGAVKRIAHLGGRMLGINPKGKHQSESWEFVKYLTTAEIFQSYNQYPAQKALLDPTKFAKTEQGYVEMLPLSITFAQYISSPARVSSMWEATNRQFGAVYSGQKKAEQAAADLVADMKTLLERGSA